ncbi:MAG: hypothetical protein SFV18_17905 [Bryobacteraceae bacterium]|nr:hypothetical protein [Bryobacteraceae bacterium]
MIDAKEAVHIAKNYFADIAAVNPLFILLEEVRSDVIRQENHQDEPDFIPVWRITVSRPSPRSKTAFPPDVDRDFRVVTIDKSDGKVLSLTLREPMHA